jgi:hypothetical protein
VNPVRDRSGAGAQAIQLEGGWRAPSSRSHSRYSDAAQLEKVLQARRRQPHSGGRRHLAARLRAERRSFSRTRVPGVSVPDEVIARNAARQREVERSMRSPKGSRSRARCSTASRAWCKEVQVSAPLARSELATGRFRRWLTRPQLHQTARRPRGRHYRERLVTSDAVRSISVMRSILLIDHGLGEAGSESHGVVHGEPAPAHGRQRHSGRHAHMELAEPSIAAGFADCVRNGATEVIAFPYMLSPASTLRATCRASCRGGAGVPPGELIGDRRIRRPRKARRADRASRRRGPGAGASTRKKACRCWDTEGRVGSCGAACAARAATSNRRTDVHVHFTTLMPDSRARSRR